MSSDVDIADDEQCAKCKTTTPSGATVCSACGYDPGGKLTRDGQLTICAGVLVSLTAIGVVVGVPLIYLGYKRMQKGKRVTVSYDLS